MRRVIADAHSDLLAELVHRRREERPFERYWRPELDAGGVGLQVCAIYAADATADDMAVRFGLQQAAAYHRLLGESGDSVVPVLAAADLDRLDGALGLLLALEGVEALGGDAALLHAYWPLGVRMVSLTWNRRNAFADGLGVEDDRGLTAEGEQLVDLLAGLGVILDLAHASPRTFAAVLERAPDATVIVSHACCRAVCETPRNLSDGHLRAIAERDGVVGIMALPITVDPERPTIERLVDHVDHAVSVMGIEHVALGGDFVRQVARAKGMTEIPDAFMPPGMPADSAVDGLEGPADYPRLVDALERRGYAGAGLDAILRGNLVRVLRQGLP
jgi:membrane dipeptidase